MNKLLLLCYLSILILYTQCDITCTKAEIGTGEGKVASCNGLAVTFSYKYVCVEDDSDATKCKQNPKCKYGTQGTATGGKVKVDSCSKLVTSNSSKYNCAKKSGESGDCEEVEKDTNSGSILKAFAFILIIIFSILLI